MMLSIPAKVLIYVWPYNFYDMTLSTGKQRRHMINCIFILFTKYMKNDFTGYMQNIFYITFQSNKKIIQFIWITICNLKICKNVLSAACMDRVKYKRTKGPVAHLRGF